MISATDGWAVGNALAAPIPANQRWTFLRWNIPAANTWNRLLVTTVGTNAVTLNSVNMISATDGWTVGNRIAAAPNGWTVLRWNTPILNTWNRVVVTTPGVGAQNLQEVTCIHANDCWAVGYAGARLHWDGAAWAAVVAPAVAQNLFSVSMIGARLRPQAAWQEDFQ